jgi:E3 ubiquitin-protein ligase MYCBP2
LNNWFLLVLRILSTKLSELIAGGMMTSSDRRLCSQICGYTMVFLEANPKRALDVVGTLDELVPMIASVNGEQRHHQDDQQQSSERSATRSVPSWGK